MEKESGDSYESDGGNKADENNSSKGGSSGAKSRGSKHDSGRSVTRKRYYRAFPNMTFEDALALGIGIQVHGAGQRIRRLTLFDKMGKSPASSTSRALITESNRYGITEGGYNSEYLSLTDMGRTATNPDASQRDKLRARFELAIGGNAIFKNLYDGLVNNKIPAREVVRDRAGELGVPESDRPACVDLFLTNAKYLGLLKVLSGAERLISLDYALDEIPSSQSKTISRTETPVVSSRQEDLAQVDFGKIVFFIALIGEEGSEHREHSDAMLGALIERAIEDTGMTVVRADQIGKPGMITSQVIEYILKSAVVVADLSFHNPNVFYELALRHVTGLPTVHIVRSEDKIPFDISDFRTIRIDTSGKYSLAVRLDSYRSEIASHIRQALMSGNEQMNPIRAFRPGLKLTM